MPRTRKRLDAKICKNAVDKSNKDLGKREHEPYERDEASAGNSNVKSKGKRMNDPRIVKKEPAQSRPSLRSKILTGLKTCSPEKPFHQDDEHSKFFGDSDHHNDHGSPSDKKVNNKKKSSSHGKKRKSGSVTKKTSVEHAVSMAQPKMDLCDSESDDHDDWEDVEDAKIPEGSVNQPPIEIQIGINPLSKPAGKKKFDVQDWYRRQANRIQQELQIKMHKTHLLMLLSHGRHINSLSLDPMLSAVSLSLLPHNLSNKDYNKICSLGLLLQWFSGVIRLDQKLSNSPCINAESMLHSFGLGKVDSYKEKVMMFACLLRALNIFTRLVFSLNPVSFKPGTDVIEKKNKVGAGFKSHQKVVRQSDNINKEIAVCDSDSEFEEVIPLKKCKTTLRGKKPNCDTLNPSAGANPIDFWLEAYIQNQWISLDCINAKMNCPENFEENCTQPVRYVLAFDNENAVKDVTCKYVGDWMGSARKLRLKDGWWEETLLAFKSKDLQREREEDLRIEASLKMTPIPFSESQLKNHPLYVLKKHLLKFEAIYPENTIPIGYMKAEPVFLREHVVQLHAREAWMKEARIVRIGEEPYKLVKGRQKRNDTSERKLQLYGHWQTDEYVPPPAHDGLVPKNEFGNVEMFKPSMLPAGTVHLRLEGLKRIAKKLDLDCAPAMVGWDFHAGGSHPVMDGFIVCEEHQEVLVAAWNEEQRNIERKYLEKLEKRVISRWAALTKGLLLRERMKKRFNLQEKPECQVGESSTPAIDPHQDWVCSQEEFSSKSLASFQRK